MPCGVRCRRCKLIVRLLRLALITHFRRAPKAANKKTKQKTNDENKQKKERMYMNESFCIGTGAESAYISVDLASCEFVGLKMGVSTIKCTGKPSRSTSRDSICVEILCTGR